MFTRTRTADSQSADQPPTSHNTARGLQHHAATRARELLTGPLTHHVTTNITQTTPASEPRHERAHAHDDPQRRGGREPDDRRPSAAHGPRAPAEAQRPDAEQVADVPHAVALAERALDGGRVSGCARHWRVQGRHVGESRAAHARQVRAAMKSAHNKPCPTRMNAQTLAQAPPQNVLARARTA